MSKEREWNLTWKQVICRKVINWEAEYSTWKMGWKCRWNKEVSGLWNTESMSFLWQIHSCMFKAYHILIFSRMKIFFVFLWWSDECIREIKYCTLIVFCSLSFISFTWQAMEASWKRTWMKMTKGGSTGR